MHSASDVANCVRPQAAHVDIRSTARNEAMSGMDGGVHKSLCESTTNTIPSKPTETVLLLMLV